LLRGKIDKVTSDQLTLTTRLGSVKVSLDKKTKITALKGVKEINLSKGKEIIVQALAQPADRFNPTVAQLVIVLK
jgi:hypothetical protein